MLYFPLWSSVNIFPAKKVQSLKLKTCQWYFKKKATTHSSPKFDFRNQDSIWHSTTCWESVFLFIFRHFHHFVNVQILVQPPRWTQHHCHTSFASTSCKSLLLGSGGTFAKLDLGPVLCPSPKTCSLPWNSFGISYSFNTWTSKIPLPIAKKLLILAVTVV